MSTKNTTTPKMDTLDKIVTKYKFYGKKVRMNVISNQNTLELKQGIINRVILNDFIEIVFQIGKKHLVIKVEQSKCTFVENDNYVSCVLNTQQKINIFQAWTSNERGDKLREITQLLWGYLK